MLEAGKKSRIYAGLQPGTDADDMRHALATGTVADRLASFHPKPGDGVFLQAGTVHALGDDVVVFEVQENSGGTNVVTLATCPLFSGRFCLPVAHGLSKARPAGWLLGGASSVTLWSGAGVS